MPAPTFVGSYVSVFNTSTSPKSTASFNVAVGDVVVAAVADEAFETSENYTFSNSGTALTWTEQTQAGGTSGSDTFVQAAHATPGAAQTGITGTLTRTNGTASHWFGGLVARFSNATMTGVTAGARTTSGDTSSPYTVSITTSLANSAILYAWVDFDALDHSGRTHQTVNGYTPTSGNGLELFYTRDSAHYTVCFAYIPDAGAAGAKTVGMSGAASADVSIVAVEIGGTASSAFTGSIGLSGSGTLSCTGTPGLTQTLGLTGSGTLTFAGTPEITGATALSGEGSLSFTSTIGTLGSATLAGDGALTFAGTPDTPGSVTLAGDGALTFTAVPALPGTLTASGSGTLSLGGAPGFSDTAALSGSGTLTLSGLVVTVGDVALSGSGSLSLGGTPAHTGTLGLTGSGVLSCTGTVGGAAFSGMVMLTGSGSLTTSDGLPAVSGTVNLGGHGVLSIFTAGGTVYRFEPPGRELRIDPTGRDFLWKRVKYIEGDAVLKMTDGSFVQVSMFDPNVPEVDTVYLGGHVHLISDPEALLLIQAGYGEYLEVVLDA